jgi:superfamily II DNA or RNA helicase
MIAPVRDLPQVVSMTPGPMVEIAGLLSVQRAWVTQFLSIKPPPSYRSVRDDRYMRGYHEGQNGSLFVAPGALQGVCRGLRAHWPGITMTTVGAWPQYSQIDVTLTQTPRDYQAHALMATRNYPRGLVVGPCGSGKTFLAIETIRHHRMPGLIVVDTGALRDEWCDRIHQITGIKPWKYGRARKDRHENPFCVATYQALVANKAGLEALGQSRGTVIVDEAHIAPANTFIDVLRFLPAARRYGFTATPEREDGLTALMYWWIGPEIAVIERSVVEDAGAIMRPRLEILVSDWTETYDPDDVHDDNRLKEAMITYEPRINLLVQDILTRMQGRFAGLVNCNSKRYCYALAERLAPHLRTAVVTSDVRQRDRKKIFADVAKGEVRVLICTSLAEKGLDIPPLDICWQATPLASAVRSEQRWGRVCRASAGKLQPIVVEVVDPHVTRQTPDGRTLRKFLNQFRRRFSAYRDTADYDKALVRRVLQGEFA